MTLAWIGVSLVSTVSSGSAQSGRATGPLRTLATNPRYFTDGSGKAIYLTGSHTWNNLQDGGWARGSGANGQQWSNYLGAFDYPRYLLWLQQHKHNFIRLWTPETAADVGYGKPVTPVAYQRTGPGDALDGQPKFDVTKLNQDYFDRLRQRVIAARDHGIYVSIMLFNVWGIGCYDNFESWKGHPYHRDNNVNGINGDPNGDGKGLECHTLAIPTITASQETYVRKVVDTVNDLDNVLYEISNEGRSDSQDWQYRMINFIKAYEAGKPKQHPVGMTALFPGTDSQLLSSAADWISPKDAVNYENDPPAATGAKVIILDTDHLNNNLQTPNRATHVWVWKSFTRGLSPIYMDQLPDLGGPICCNISPTAEDVRRAMGHTRSYANKMNLAAMTPQNGLSSTAYCLAKTGSEYLVYQPADGVFTVTLAGGKYAVEWFNSATGKALAGGTVSGGATVSFTPPFDGDAVLYLRSPLF